MSAEAKTFEYAVRDKSGKLVKGRVEAPNQAAVANRLRDMGLAAVSISEVSATGLNREINIGGDRVSLKDLAVMSRQMATMIDSGLSLLRALSILAEQTESKVLAKIIGQVRNDVEVGTALSVALQKHEHIFPPLMINMVKAGEVGGFLDKALVSVADNFEAEVKLRNKIKSAMTYPVVVFVVAILATIGMLLFIVPVFAGMFTTLGGELPLPTKILMQMSQAMKILILPLVVGLVIFSVWWARHKNDRGVRERLDPIKLKMPVFGNLFRKIAVARFTRNFGTMLHSGVPLLQALDVVGRPAATSSSNARARTSRSRCGAASRLRARCPTTRSSRPWWCR